MAWQEAAKAKKASQAQLIPADWRIDGEAHRNLKNVLSIPFTCGILSPSEITITELDDVDSLLEKLASGEWAAEDVMVAVSGRRVLDGLAEPPPAPLVLQARSHCSSAYKLPI